MRMPARADQGFVLEVDNRSVPTAALWNGRRYRVSDVPTQLEMDYFAMTHPLPEFAGWRFQGTADDDDCRVFDVRRDAAGSWRLLCVYD